MDTGKGSGRQDTVGKTPDQDVKANYNYRRKPRINKSRLPWNRGNQFYAVSLDPDFLLTQELLTCFAIKPKAILADLLLKPQRPTYPISEWENIISGRPVDLDVVHRYLGGEDEEGDENGESAG